MRGLERALVIGGAGFYGGWLVAKLAAQGIETTVLDRNADPTAPGVARAVLGEAHEIDLVGLIHETRADAIFQLAGTGLVPTSISDPMGDLLVNVRTTVATLEAARSVPPPPLVLLVSSAAVYGEQQQLTMD